MWLRLRFGERQSKLFTTVQFKYQRRIMFRVEKAFRFWIGLSIASLASFGLVTMLWLIFVYYPANYHSMHWDYPTHFNTYFWQYYVWQILTATALSLIGLFLMRTAVKRRR